MLTERSSKQPKLVTLVHHQAITPETLSTQVNAWCWASISSLPASRNVMQAPKGN